MISEWIADNVEGLSFCDIGGIGVGARNERISIAVRSGAKSATMIDYRRSDFKMWRVFRDKMKEKGIEGFLEIDNANLEHPGFPQRVGAYDFVHSTGILYHAPAPMTMLFNLSRISRKYLITNTVILPEHVRTPRGNLEFAGSQAVFVPGLTDTEREILDVHYQQLLGWPAGRFGNSAPRLGDGGAKMPYLQNKQTERGPLWGDDGGFSYSPYWWLFTAKAFRAAVEMFGFRIVEEELWKSHALSFFCRREFETGSGGM